MTPKFLIGLALAAGVVLPGAASAQRYDRNDPGYYRYYDEAGRLRFDRQAWRAHEERRKRQLRNVRYQGHYDRYDRREWRRDQRAEARHRGYGDYRDYRDYRD